MKKKIKKLIRNPGVFFRDFLVKKYPEINTEQQHTLEDEAAVYLAERRVNALEKMILMYENQEIDAVFTWVNDQDLKWIEKKKRYLIESKLSCENSADDARFENHNELYYSVLAVKKYLPWVRKIFIVTDQQVPEWFDDTDSKIKIIDHRDIIDDEFLPTFNSHVIEAHLHKIEGLSENFIYFNDDVFVARYLEPEHFFKKNGLASFFLSNKNVDEMRRRGVVTATLKASINVQQLLKRSTGYYVANVLVHSYVPLKKSMFEKIWQEHKKDILNFLPNRFRGNEDLNLATFFVPWLMYIEGKSIVGNEVCYYFNVRSNHALNQYQKLLNMKDLNVYAHSFCANDFSSKILNKNSNFEKKLIETLENYYQDIL